MADALFKRTEDGYWLSFTQPGIEFTCDRLRWDRDELHGQVCVATGLCGARTVDGVLLMGTLNLSSTRARREKAKELSERVRVKDRPPDFIGMLDEVCLRVLKAERQGTPAIDLRQVPRPDPEDEHEVDGFRFPKRHPTIVFGDGGTLKSLHALRTAGVLARDGLRVLFVDYELDAAAHRGRLEGLFGLPMPQVLYVRGERPLIYEIDRLKAVVRDEHIDFVIVDSIGYACPGPPEAAEHAVSYFRAVRQLRIGSYHIAHVRQGEGNDQRPFGSAFWHNSARATWYVKLAATLRDGAGLTIGLFNRKSNLTALRAAVGFEVRFERGSIRFDRVNVADVQELAESLPLWQRMKSALTHGPLTLARLADDLEANVDTVERTVRRKGTLFTRVSSQDGITRIALVRGAA